MQCLKIVVAFAKKQKKTSHTSATSWSSKTGRAAITNETIPALNTFSTMHTGFLGTFWRHNMAGRSDGTRVLI